MSAYRDAADRVLCEEEGVRLTAAALTLPDGTVFPIECDAPSVVMVDRDRMRPGQAVLVVCVLLGCAAAAPEHGVVEAVLGPALLMAGLAPWTLKRRHRLTLENGARTASYTFASAAAADRMMKALHQLLPAPAPAPAPRPAPASRPKLHLRSVHPPAPRDSLGSLNLAAKHRLHSNAAESGAYARVLSEKDEAERDEPGSASGRARKR
jgi:hypothetical protein